PAVEAAVMNRRFFLHTILFLTICSVIATARTVSPVARLTESDGQDGYDIFGNAVAIDGDTVVVADEAWGEPESYKGSVYVFVKQPGNRSEVLTQTAKLTASDGVAGDSFGTAVAIHGDTIVVGAPDQGLHGPPGKNLGTIYVFVRPAGGWTDMTETAKLTTSDD